MKKKIVISLFVFTIISCLLSLGFNIYFLATKPKSASGIFYNTKESILELKAETEDIGVSYGTGVVVSKDGTIVTNAHVVTYKQLGQTYAFESVSVRFIDEEEFRKVSVLKYDTDLDVAVLKLESDRKLEPINFGDETQLKHGDKVYALGNMSNYGISMTAGQVSIPLINVSYEEKNRQVIQCDLTISDGNSGGALVDKNGKLIGMTTFRLKDISNNVVYGISYSIPAGAILEYIKNS